MGIFDVGEDRGVFFCIRYLNLLTSNFTVLLSSFSLSISLSGLNKFTPEANDKLSLKQFPGLCPRVKVMSASLFIHRRKRQGCNDHCASPWLALYHLERSLSRSLSRSWSFWRGSKLLSSAQGQFLFSLPSGSSLAFYPSRIPLTFCCSVKTFSWFSSILAWEIP